MSHLLREALKQTLSALVATTSLIIRAEDIKKRPSQAVASDKMFCQMLEDYDKATIAARAALVAAPTTANGLLRAVRTPSQSNRWGVESGDQMIACNLSEEVARLIVTLHSSLVDAAKRLRGAGMLPDDTDEILAAIAEVESLP